VLDKVSSSPEHRYTEKGSRTHSRRVLAVEVAVLVSLEEAGRLVLGSGTARESLIERDDTLHAGGVGRSTNALCVDSVSLVLVALSSSWCDNVGCAGGRGRIEGMAWCRFCGGQSSTYRGRGNLRAVSMRSDRQQYAEQTDLGGNECRDHGCDK
jgi:hypothetical protein